MEEEATPICPTGDGGHVPSVDMSNCKDFDVLGGQVPSDPYNNIHKIPSPLVLEVEPSSALVFIEELISEEIPAARSLGRLGVTTGPPVAFIGVARRWCFSTDVVILSYKDSGRFPLVLEVSLRVCGDCEVPSA